MQSALSDELRKAFEACETVAKSEDGEFSYKWLRSAGYNFRQSMLARLVRLGYLRVRYNGILRCRTPWYSVL